MKDIIDERDEKARISRSIIKYWNVNYVAKPAEEDEAEKILKRLAEEAAADEAEKQAEIEAALEEARLREEAYNVKTKSYSGSYGMDGIEDEVTKGQIDKILHEKTDALEDLIKQKTEDNEQIDRILQEKDAALRDLIKQTEDNEQIDRILQEKDTALRDLIKQTEDNGQKE